MNASPSKPGYLVLFKMTLLAHTFLKMCASRYIHQRFSVDLNNLRHWWKIKLKKDKEREESCSTIFCSMDVI